MGDAITIHLIRHGKTKANVERKYIGHTDEPILPLTPVQLTVRPSIVYGSDLQRCRQTAACYFPYVPYKANADLRELHFGQFEMKTYEELKDYPLYQKWLADPLQVTPPDGESFIDFTARVERAMKQIIIMPGDYTFVVHGGVIRLLLAKFLQHPFNSVYAEHSTIYSCTWSHFSAWKEGERCTSTSEVPIMASESM
ncbi:histidine phosphatase family protein [Metasolibacillus sp.]|uniref:histidine phosphatase family protein n=1 Tax=Metasolibacillus sp. TaxID=2703680 RepID=UPI0025D74410|nr:histidine phosphatase family protein [Metasolibacillus sp.]MCT6922590.1 histidine phosphatase family protein [Metasolibacillus sp.]MCT6939071.1 histidine phosphatase family protein [Metasolibacillus sp.]